MRRFSELDKHYDRHNEGICCVCGCSTDRWKSICDSCRDEAIKKENEKLKKGEHNSDAPNPESATQTPLPVSDATQLKEEE